MNIILGASGHIGSAAAKTLIEAGNPVTAVLRDPAKAAEWTARGAKTAVVDVHDSDVLREVFKTGKRAFLLIRLPIFLPTRIKKRMRRSAASFGRSMAPAWRRWSPHPRSAPSPENATEISTCSTISSKRSPPNQSRRSFSAGSIISATGMHSWRRPRAGP